MKRMKNFQLMLVALALVWTAPMAQADGDYRSYSPIERDVRVIKHTFDDFCDQMNRYLRRRYIDQNAQYARRTLSDFGAALDRLAVDAARFGSGSPLLKRRVEDVQTRYFRAKHYLKYLNLPVYLERNFGALTGKINRLDDRGGRPGHGGDYPHTPRRIDLESYGDQLERAADSLLRYARSEAPRGWRGNRPHPGLQAAQVLEDLTNEFKKRADDQYRWTPGLIGLHGQIEAQYRTVGRFVREFGRSTTKEYYDFGRTMNGFLQRNPYSRSYDRDDRGPGRDRHDERGRGGDRGREPGRDRPVTFGGDSWSIRIGGVF